MLSCNYLFKNVASIIWFYKRVLFHYNVKRTQGHKSAALQFPRINSIASYDINKEQIGTQRNKGCRNEYKNYGWPFMCFNYLSSSFIIIFFPYNFYNHCVHHVSASILFVRIEFLFFFIIRNKLNWMEWTLIRSFFRCEQLQMNLIQTTNSLLWLMAASEANFMVSRVFLRRTKALDNFHALPAAYALWSLHVDLMQIFQWPIVRVIRKYANSETKRRGETHHQSSSNPIAMANSNHS